MMNIICGILWMLAGVIWIGGSGYASQGLGKGMGITYVAVGCLNLGVSVMYFMQ